MLRAPITFVVALLLSAIFFSARAQPASELEVFSGNIQFSPDSDRVSFTNDVVIKWYGAVLTADSVEVDRATGEATARGNVRIQKDDQTWTGERIGYNFKTGQLSAAEFRTGQPLVFAQGRGLHGAVTNQAQTVGDGLYTATNAFVTLDDISDPFIRIRAHRVRIVPGQYIAATHAILYVGQVPVFYFPYYKRNLGERSSNLNLVPGYRGVYGAFLLTDYTWFLNERLDGSLHVDYRQKRGVGAGPDLNFHLGRWGEGFLSYYYARDEDAGTNLAGLQIPDNRQRLEFAYQANPLSDVSVKSVVRYQNDSDFIRDFFPSEYRRNPQPWSFVEASKFWQNFSVNALVQPRVNDFWETVERWPDVRLVGFPQEIPKTPFYYESQSSVGHYRRLFVGSNSPFPSSTTTLFSPPGMIPPDIASTRADTFHQVSLPQTFFGWLNVKPMVGGRLTYYGPVDVAGAGITLRTNSDTYRAVFNTGAEMSFKLSQLWPDLRNKTLALDGLRHILEPSFKYVYVPRPNYTPDELPQFDSELPSLRPLPIGFPEFSSIDTIDSENVVRLGVRNRLQTKRNGAVGDFLDWEVFTDWRLQPRGDQNTFSDLYSTLILRPRSWIVIQSITRLDVNEGDWRMALHTLTFQPNDTWSWGFGHFYLQDDFRPSTTALGQGNDSITSTLFYRLNQNWAARASIHYDLRNQRMQEQYYTLYRDMRSWTAGLAVGLLDNGEGPRDFTIAFTFSIKARPKFGVGGDTVRSYSLLGLQ